MTVRVNRDDGRQDGACGKMSGGFNLDERALNDGQSDE
jgi:hypothetical protein